MPSQPPRRSTPLGLLLLLLAAVAPPLRAQDPALPAPCPAEGGLDYYRCRAGDALRRRPDATPPEYYLGYGDRYVRRFTHETRPLLSPEGQRWLDRTRQALQDAIEARRAADPAAFARLEADEEGFLDFAYETHPEAYLRSGLAALPARDLLLIATTPDVQDLLSPRGLRQVVTVLHALARTCQGEGVGACALTRVLREAEEHRRLLADDLGLRPASLAGGFLVARIIDSTLRALGLAPKTTVTPTPGLSGALDATRDP